MVASRGRLLAPGGMLGLRLFIMGFRLPGSASRSAAGGIGGSAADSGDEDCHTWDHTARTMTYTNLLTLRCTALIRCLVRQRPDVPQSC